MKKDEFIKRLEENLGELDKEELKKTISSYKTKITKRVKKGEKEEDVIASFGDVDLMSKNILKKYDIKPELSDEAKMANQNFIKTFTSLINNLIDYVGKGDYKTIFRLLGEVLIIALIVIVLKVPFELLKSSMIDIFAFFGNTLSETMVNLSYLAIEILYFIFAIYLFIRMFNRRVSELLNKVKINKKTTKNS